MIYFVFALVFQIPLLKRLKVCFLESLPMSSNNHEQLSLYMIGQLAIFALLLTNALSDNLLILVQASFVSIFVIYDGFIVYRKYVHTRVES